MQGYIGMKIDYLRRSKERLRELESDIDCLIENVPSMEKEVTENGLEAKLRIYRKKSKNSSWMSLKCRRQIGILRSGHLKLKIRSGSSRC